MKRLGIKRSFGIIILVAVILLGAIYGVRSVYAAIGNVLPAGGDMIAGGKNGHIELHLKKLDVAQVLKNKMSAYYPSWDTSSNGKSVKVTAGPLGRVCNIDEPKLSGDIRITITVANNSVSYDIPIDRVCDTNDFYSQTFDFPNGTLYNDPGIAMTRADITVHYRATPQLPANSGSDLNYEMHLTGNNNANGLLALRSNDAYDEFGLRSSYSNNPGAADNNNVQFSVPFGYPCSEDVSPGFKRQVKLYDADGVFGDTYMWVEKDDRKLNFEEYGTNMQLIQGWDGGNKRWKLNNSNNTFNMLTLAEEYVERGAKYALHVNNNGNGGSLNPHYNTLSVGTPQDSIYARGDCDYKLEADTSIDSSTYVYYPNIQVTGLIRENPDGPIPEGHPWEIYAVRYAGEPSTRSLTDDPVANGNPCSNGVLPSGGSGCLLISPGLSYTAQSSHTQLFNGGGPDPVGTRLCFFTRVQNPTHMTSDDTQWVYSDMRCSVSVKKPRVQFLGSDLRVGGYAQSSYYKVQSNNYGSWAEYGMFTAGSNSIVTSGNGLRGGNPNDNVSDWNRLTFANTPSYGGYSPVPAASSAYTYFRNLPASGGNFSQGSPASGVYDLGNNPTIGNLNVTANGRSIILRASGTITIGNITVLNQGVTNATNLSQVVIVADNIEFTNSSNRADAWLITSPTGYINTCNIGAQALTSGPCSGVLTVNGPVFTNRLMLRRTGGANPPTAAQLSEPAERFNLRPDAQLWAYTYANRADYAQTDYVQELPPRY